MGRLIYDSNGPAVEFDDRTLAHLKVVMAAKLRRHESFTLSWIDPEGQGRHTVWIHPSIPVRFEFDGLSPRDLNHEWIERLADSTVRTSGIVVTAEDDGAHAAPAGATVSADDQP